LVHLRHAGGAFLEDFAFDAEEDLADVERDNARAG
jgi:hypothetical protein